MLDNIKMKMVKSKIEKDFFTVLVKKVQEEILNAERKFPEWPVCPIIGASIMMEEAGEAVRAANHYGFYPSDENRNALRMELIQTAAMCFRMLNALKEAEKQPEPIPPEPQGMSLEEVFRASWEPYKHVFFPWPEFGGVASVRVAIDAGCLRALEVPYRRFGGKPFYRTKEEAQAHADWLEKYGEGR